MHIRRCKDPGHDQVFHLMINELHSWIESTLGNRAVATTIGAYLCARGEITMRSLRRHLCRHDYGIGAQQQIGLGQSSRRTDHMTLASVSCSFPPPNAKEPSSPILGATIYTTPPQSCSQTIDIQKRIYSF